MDVVIIALGVLIVSFLTLIGFVWWYLFFRSAFNAPKDIDDIQANEVFGIPYLTENDMPYPSGIQATDHSIFSLDGVWDFHLDGETEISQVNIPSCFNTADSPLRDYQDLVWYEREFTLPAHAEGNLIRLAFLGSFYRTEVWLDNRLLEEHEGGYLPFYFDLTDFVSSGVTHKLKVRVDNRIDSTSLPPHLFQGHNLGWHPYGGLHRSVFVEICPPTYCFKIDVDAIEQLDGGQVNVSVLFHHYHKDKTPLQTATLSLVAPNGHSLTETASSVQWDEANQFGIVKCNLTIPRPQLWEPSSPHLYRIEIRTEHERCETTFGFRKIKVQDGKLLLNDKPLLLKGVCRHQEDRENGLTQGPDAIQYELEMVKSLNGNFVRLAHYPHSSETLDLCDQIGLCAWTEIPLYQAGLGVIRFLFDKTKRDTGKTLFALPGIIWNTRLLTNPSLLHKARNELLKMIERDRNHPSVLFWGLGNECWTLNPAGAKALAWLKKQAEAYDSKRLFVYAAFAMPVLGPLYERSFDVSDVVGINEYFGWYYGKVQETGAYLKSLSSKYPHKPLIVTETGADAVRGQHTNEVPPSRGRSEEYQAWYLEEQWRQMRNAPTFSGLSIWVLKDFLCPEYREDNPVPFYNLKGLLDRDALPKGAFDKVRTIFGEE